jgi:hypothetical protein
MSKTSLRNSEITVLNVSLDNSFLLTIKEKATMNSSIVQKDVTKPTLSLNILFKTSEPISLWYLLTIAEVLRKLPFNAFPFF